MAERPSVTVGIPTRNRSGLLRRTIESVLAQTYPSFTLVVSDNGSDDDTAEVVASYEDPRLVYRPRDPPVERAENYNGLVESAETDFVVLVADDDELLPDHLALSVEALERWPSAGVAHTGYLMIDGDGNTLAQHVSPFRTAELLVFESGRDFLERSMRKSGPTMAFSSAVFRKAAFLDGDRLRLRDGVSDDFPLFLRIATRWDFAYVNRALALVRAHEETSSSELGSFTEGGFRSSRSAADVLYENRSTFLAEADLSEIEARRLAHIAERTHRRDRVRHLSMRATTGDKSVAVFRALGRVVRRDRRLALDPITWRFVVGQLGGRRLRDGVRRALEPERRRL